MMLLIRFLSVLLLLLVVAILIWADADVALIYWMKHGADGAQAAQQFMLAKLSQLALAILSPRIAIPSGAMLACLVFAAQAKRADREAGNIWLLMGLPCLAGPLGYWFLTAAMPMLGQRAPWSLMIPWGIGAASGLAAALLWLRFGTQRSERIGWVLSRRSRLERNRRTDVREIDKVLPREIGRYDPAKYHNPKKGVFVGLDETRRPIYISADTWRLSHVLLSGRTRSGKGVAAQILLSQAIARGEFVVVLDPKADEWMPHVFWRAAQQAGRPYHYLDLRPGRAPQINPFLGADEECVEAMLIGAFGLAERGEAADFYRLADRRAAREAAALIAPRLLTASDALAEQGRDWSERAAGFHAALEEMADLAAVNARHGLDLEALARSGGCVYVVGDMGNTRVVRQQRMLLLRLMMMAKAAQARGESRPLMTVFADEFKVHISRPFVAALGAAAGWGLHLILAMQSLQDLADVPGDLDREAVRGAIMENCALQLSYRIKDPETAEWLAASTGKILVDDEIRRIDRNLALSETVDTSRQVRQAERYYVDTNMFLNLPAGCGVLTGTGTLPEFCYTSPVAVTKNDQALAVVGCDTAQRAPTTPQEGSQPLQDDGARFA